MNSAVKFENFYKLVSTYEIFVKISKNLISDYENFVQLQQSLKLFEDEVMDQAGLSITNSKLVTLLEKLHNIKDLLDVSIEKSAKINFQGHILS